MISELRGYVIKAVVVHTEVKCILSFVLISGRLSCSRIYDTCERTPDLLYFASALLAVCTLYNLHSVIEQHLLFIRCEQEPFSGVNCNG